MVVNVVVRVRTEKLEKEKAQKPQKVQISIQSMREKSLCVTIPCAPMIIFASKANAFHAQPVMKSTFVPFSIETRKSRHSPLRNFVELWNEIKRSLSPKISLPKIGGDCYNLRGLKYADNRCWIDSSLMFLFATPIPLLNTILEESKRFTKELRCTNKNARMRTITLLQNIRDLIHGEPQDEEEEEEDQYSPTAKCVDLASILSTCIPPFHLGWGVGSESKGKPFQLGHMLDPLLFFEYLFQDILKSPRFLIRTERRYQLPHKADYKVSYVEKSDDTYFGVYQPFL